MLPRRRAFVPAALALLALLAAACDRPPTAPPAPGGARPSRAVAASGTGIVAQHLGTLPGDVRSEATYVTEDGIVYGRSYAPGSATPRFFRWTQTGGMVQVSSIPQPARPPRPTITSVPFPFERVTVTAANVKGEATGVLCQYDCNTSFYSPTDYGGHVFRYSPGAGTRELDTRRFDPTTPELTDLSSHGWSINAWGHVAGVYWENDFSDPRPFLWTPVDSFRLVPVTENDVGNTLVNDADQVLAQQRDEFATIAIAWRPDLATLRLEPSTTVGCTDGCETEALAQQRAGSLVVGRMSAGTGPFAALWRVPAVNRSAFPKVNANLYSASSTLSLASTGGRYYQTYKATQATASGPYLELVDWGDGKSSRRTRSSIGVTTSQVHTYSKRGTYWVRVYVKDAQGRWGVSERKVTVTA